MRTLAITPEMEEAAREVMSFPHFRPGATVPPFMVRQAKLLEFVRVMGDAVLGTQTPPIVVESAESSEPKVRKALAPSPTRLNSLTAPQLAALDRMPADWFFSEVLSHAIHAADGMCQRLVKKGWLEQRSACPPDTNLWEWSRRVSHTAHYEYRKLPHRQQPAPTL